VALEGLWSGQKSESPTRSLIWDCLPPTNNQTHKAGGIERGARCTQEHCASDGVVKTKKSGCGAVGPPGGCGTTFFHWGWILCFGGGHGGVYFWTGAMGGWSGKIWGKRGSSKKKPKE